MELGCNFILIICSTAKISSVQIIIARKMQTHDFDFYYHFNPLQKLFNMVLPSWKNPTPHDICSSQRAIRKIWLEKTIFLTQSAFEPWHTTFLKTLPPDWNNLWSTQTPSPLIIHSPSKSDHSAQSQSNQSKWLVTACNLLIKIKETQKKIRIDFEKQKKNF